MFLIDAQPLAVAAQPCALLVCQGVAIVIAVGMIRSAASAHTRLDATAVSVASTACRHSDRPKELARTARATDKASDEKGTTDGIRR